ncbi:gliding motility-associated C-terminal domain-containing protein [Capnocytophaga canimorsus]|uniref:T9SS type B sorting domain-containing protein n=1 Tax=Capnocytophaga canimorsus TaxID=28188 RepID=UPI00385DF54E
MRKQGTKKVFASVCTLRIWMLVWVNLLLLGTRAMAQVVIPPDGITVQSGQEIAQSPNAYELGKLKVLANFSGSGDAVVMVTLPEGVTMKPSTLKIESGNGNITSVTETGSVVTFTIVGASGDVTFSLEKLLSPLAHRKATTNNPANPYELSDKIKIVKGGVTVERQSGTYSYKYPLMSLTGISANNNAIFGQNTGTFELLNGGNGKIFDIYFTIEYPQNIQHTEVSYQGVVLNHIIQNGNKYTFLLPSNQHSGGNGLSNGQSVVIGHKYNVRKACLNEQLIYTVNWGESQNEIDWYEYKDNIAERTVSSASGTPNIEIVRKNVNLPNPNGTNDNTDYAKTYFTPKPNAAGCYVVGESVGTLRYAFKNYGANTNAASAIYKLVMYFREGRNDATSAFFRPENFYVINPDTGAKTPLTLTPATATGIAGSNKLYKVDFSGLTTDPDGTGKGLEDLDGDGKYNELPSQSELIVEYDLVVNRADNYTNCISPNFSGSLIYDQYMAYATYETSCGDKVGGQGDDPLQGGKPMQNNAYANYLKVVPSSEIPAHLIQVEGAQPARFMFSSDVFYILRRTKTGGSNGTGGNAHSWRIQYNINLPEGVKATNVQWVNSSTYPNSVTPQAPFTGSVVSGQNLVVIAPYTNSRGYVIMDLEVDCNVPNAAGTKQISYEVLMTEDIVNAPNCKRKLLCETKPITLICGDNCTNNGPSLTKTTGERAENSYGWTDHTMQTRHTKTTMPAEMLKRALYLDDVEITAVGKQKGQANNLHYSFTTNPGVSLNPKEIKFTFTSGTRSGTTVQLDASQAQIQRFNDTGTNAWKERYVKVIWNLTSALNGIPLENNDTFKVTATYQVDRNSERLDNAKDIPAGKESYFFMYDTDGVTELYCGIKRTPDFFVANTSIQYNGLNGYQLDACVPKNIGTNLIHLARRFSAAGTSFVDEFRPDRLIKTFSFTLPKTYSVSQILYDYKITNTGTKKRIEINIPIDDFVQTTEGNNIVYTLQNTYDPVSKTYKLPPGLITLHNEYVAVIRVIVQASCGSKTDKSEFAKTNTTHYDYFYHYGLNTPYGVPHTGSPEQTEGTNQPIDYRNKPGVKLEVVGNSTFDIVHAEQELKIKLTNKNASYAAPYTWVSIPRVTGIEVVGLYQGGTSIPRQSISGEDMYHISTAGLNPGQSQEYTIKVRLTDCSTATLNVYSGWNCNSFPTSYNQTCSSATDPSLSDSQTSFTLNHSGSEVQLKRLVTPNPEVSIPSSPESERARLHMCEDNWYEYEINSGKPGDVVNPQIAITKEQGIDIPEIQVFYPFNSTATKTLVPVDNNTTVVYDLLNSNQVLYGTASGQDENHRKIRVRINVKPSCDFRVGSTFGIEVLGKNTCGGALDGTRDNAITASIEGVNALNYTVINTLDYQSGDANRCSTGAIYQGKHQISASGANSSGSNGKVVLRLPQGFDIVAGSFATTGQLGSFNLTEAVIDAGVIVPSGEKEYKITIPSGMYNGNYFTYQIAVKQPDDAQATNCGVQKQIQYYTIDVANTVTCGAAQCSEIRIITAEPKETEIKASRASLTIEDMQVTSMAENNKEKLTFSFNVRNTAAIAYDGKLTISLFDDTNNNGTIDATDTFVSKIELPQRNYPASGVVTGLSYSLEFGQEQICRLRAKILSSENNCLCDASDIKVPSPNPLSNLVSDLEVCESEIKQFQYNLNAPDYELYNWTSSQAGAMAYLQGGTNIKSPSFVYTGAALTTSKTFTYTLIVRRANGCEASQQVVVTVNPKLTKPSISTSVMCDVITVAQLKALVTGTPVGSTINVYNNNETVPLADNTPLVDGTTYQIGYVVVGGCSSARLDYLFKVAQKTDRGYLNDAHFCDASDVAALKQSIRDGEPARIADALAIYETETATTALSDNTPLVGGKKYSYKYTAMGKCESVGRDITVTLGTAVLNVPTPSLAFCQTPMSEMYSFANLVTPTAGYSLKWYPTQTATTTLPVAPTIDKSIVVTAVYYVSQVRDNAPHCESERKAVSVVIKPAITTQVDVVNATCGNSGSATIANYDPTFTYTFSDAAVTRTGATITGFAFGTTYTMTVSNGTCTKDISFVVSNTCVIDAVDDIFSPVSGTVGGEAGNVLSDNGNGKDKLGNEDATTSNVQISVVTPAGTGNVPQLDTTTGKVTVPVGTPAGTYTIVYKICDNNNLSNCDTATATILVSTIEANDDDMSDSPVNGAVGNPNVVNVLTNDIFDGVPNIPISKVKLTVISQATPIGSTTNVPTLDSATGDVSVPTGTPAGTYTITYEICISGTTICDTATVTVVVTAQDIVAQDDTFASVLGAVGGRAGNVLSDNGNGADMLGSNPATVANVTISEVTPATPIGTSTNVPSLNIATGEVTVPANTPAGTYSIVYQICEKLNPSNCDTATATVVVTAQLIKAQDDTFAPIAGVTGGTAGNVLSDNGKGTDMLGVNSATVTDVTISEVTPATPIGTSTNVPSLNIATGEVTVPANTPAGTYSIVYQICEKLNPSNCSTATATVVVSPADLEAVPDDFSATPIGGTDGGKTSSVLTNDKLNGTPLNPSDVTLTWGTIPSGFTPNADGTITVVPNTPAGTYTLTYTICEVLNPSNCKTTRVTVLVTASPIVANDDDYTMYPIYTTVGGTVSASVLVNDTIEGVEATLATVTISNPTTPNTNINIDPASGMVVVLPNTPVGTYTLTYTICEKGNPTNCSNQANVIVVVLDVPKASDDSATTEINTPVVVNILENDQNIPAIGKVSVVSGPSQGSVQVNDGGTPNDPSDDTVTYTPNPGFVGTDSFVYELCDAAGNCASATVTIEVVAGGDITPYNAISINDDGSNDVFYIKGIEGYPNNTVRIYNRWGVKVFEAHGYNNTTKAFRGISNGRVTVDVDKKLPQGTYYYVIEYVDKNNQTKRKGSWLYIKR